ncbi:MAG: ABC transporter permease [Polyangiales bacterium]
MRGLDKKLLRDLSTLRWQLFSIALVIASGSQALVATYGTYRSLVNARDRFYAATAFPDVFVRLTRAPERVADTLAHVDGVAGVQTRLTFDVPLDLEGMRAPVVGRMISLPAPGRSQRERLVVETGRLPGPTERDAVAVNEAFARARHLRTGDRVAAVLNGRRQELTIVGTVLSPEHVAALRPGEVIPDDAHFGILFASDETIATAYQAEGTFNEALIWLAPGADAEAVIGGLDRRLFPYGGYGAYDRSEQPANRFVESELEELEVEATVLPVIFLVVAAFLLNVVLARIVTQERTQIATLRALGFRKAPIVRHYLALASLVGLVGASAGAVIGVVFGIGMTASYEQFFRFPDLAYEVDPGVIVASIATGLAAATLGASASARRIASLAPAEAMQPPTPLAFHESWLERSGLSRRLAPTLRLVVRNVVSRPARTAAAIVGVAAAMGILVVGAFWYDALEELVHQQFRRVQHEDAVVTFVDPVPERAARELAHAPGIRLVEGVRAVPARLATGRSSKRIELLGLDAGSTLRTLVTRDGHEVSLPPDGILLSRHLAEKLHVGRGSRLSLEVLEGERARRSVTVAGVIDERLGMSAYARLDFLRRLLDEGPVISAALLSFEPGREAIAEASLRRFPRVGAVSVKRTIIRRFEATLMQIILVFSGVLTLFGGLVVAGVVYNAARILVAEREREMATLRVLGFTRGDISEALLLELAVQIVPALGLGALFGYGLAAVAVRLFGPEDMSIPLFIGARTWALAFAVVLVCSLASALVVRRRLDRLDLVAVLKVRE